MTVPVLILAPLLTAALQAAPIVVVAPTAPAQPPATILVEPAAMLIAACDANGDAKVTRGELDACLARSYATAEGAASGKIGYIAYADWCQAWLGDRNALPSPFEVDHNGDDRITLAELQARFAQYFTRYDINRDAVLTRAELVTIRARPPQTGEEPRKKKR